MKSLTRKKNYARSFPPGVKSSGGQIMKKLLTSRNVKKSLLVSIIAGFSFLLSERAYAYSANGSITNDTTVVDSCDASFTTNFIGDLYLMQFFRNASISDDATLYWSFGDSTFSELNSDVVHEYPGPGNYLVTLAVIDSLMQESCDYAKWINIPGDSVPVDSCNISFYEEQLSFSDTTNTSGYAVQFFRGGSIGDDASVSWNFGDGTISSENADVVHTYDSPGDYYVCLSLLEVDSVQFDTLTSNCVYCKSISVQGDSIPTDSCDASFTTSFIGDLYLMQFFRNASISDDATLYWSFGDSTFSELNDDLVHEYPGPGNYLVTLAMIDSLTQESCDYAKWINIPGDSVPVDSCNISFYEEQLSFSDTTNTSGYAVQFFRGGLIGDDVNVSWNFGDGTISSENADVVHTYDSPGDYYVCLSLLEVDSVQFDTLASNCVYCKSISVQGDSIPTDSCDASFTTNYIGDLYLMQFFRNASIPDHALTYWSFGDSTFSELNDDLVHEYPGPGDYLVTLAVIDSLTQESCDYAKWITIPDDSCALTFAYMPKDNCDSSDCANVVTFMPSGSDSSKELLWDFGDGNSATSFGDTTIDHKYDEAGSYQVCLSFNQTIAISDSSLSCIKCSQVVIESQEGNEISGAIYTDLDLLSEGVVLLYEMIGNDWSFSKLATVNNGQYSLENIKDGKYLLYAIPSLSLSRQFAPTYFVNSYSWRGAYELTMNGSNLKQVNITLINTAGLRRNGVGIISGFLVDNRSKSSNARYLSPTENTKGTVILSDLEGNIIDWKKIDGEGLFDFGDLPYGTYKLSAELPSTRSIDKVITVSSSQKVFRDLEVALIEKDQVIARVKENLSSRLSYYPQPVGDQLKLKLKGSSIQKAQFVVRSLASGQILLSKNVSFANGNEIMIDMHGLAQGTYIGQVITNGEYYSFKIIK